jgi:hypothetical protein
VLKIKIEASDLQNSYCEKYKIMHQSQFVVTGIPLLLGSYMDSGNKRPLYIPCYRNTNSTPK